MSSPGSSYNHNLTQSVLNTPIHQTLGLSLLSQSLSCTGIPTAKLQFTTTSLHLTSSNTVHGGISSLCIDGACFLAAIPSMKEGESTATIASSFQTVGAVEGEGKRYEVEGRVIRRGRKVIFCEGDVKCGEVLIARGSLTKIITQGPVKKDGKESRL